MAQELEQIYKISIEVCKDLIRELSGLVFSLVLFGSSLEKPGKNSDIDLLLILDDINFPIDSLTKDYIQKSLNKIYLKYKPYNLHLTVMYFSEFFERIKTGDPFAINILRQGVPILDRYRILETFKKMLYLGKLKPSKEAAEILKNRINYHIANYHNFLIKALETVYFIFLDSAQSMLLYLNIHASTPENIKYYLKKLTEKGILKERYLIYYKGIYDLIKKIAHREINNVSAETIEKWYIRALDFKEACEEVINKNKKTIL